MLLDDEGLPLSNTRPWKPSHIRGLQPRPPVSFENLSGGWTKNATGDIVIPTRRAILPIISCPNSLVMLSSERLSSLWNVE